MTVDEVRAMAHSVTADVAEAAPDVRLDRDEDVVGLFAYFGADRSRRLVRVVIGGEAAGYVERGDVLDLFDIRSMGLGDSDRAALMGKVPATRWRFHELECPVAGCPEPTQFVVTFEADDPPHCRVHPDQALRLRS